MSYSKRVYGKRKTTQHNDLFSNSEAFAWSSTNVVSDLIKDNIAPSLQLSLLKSTTNNSNFKILNESVNAADRHVTYSGKDGSAVCSGQHILIPVVESVTNRIENLQLYKEGRRVKETKEGALRNTLNSGSAGKVKRAQQKRHKETNQASIPLKERDGNVPTTCVKSGKGKIYRDNKDASIKVGMQGLGLLEEETGGRREEGERKHTEKDNDTMKVDRMKSKQRGLSTTHQTLFSEHALRQPSTPAPIATKAAKRSSRPTPSPLVSSTLKATTNILSKKATFFAPLTAHVAPLLALATDPLARASPISFRSWTDELDTYFHVAKIAEASYGEVYRLSLRNEEGHANAGKHHRGQKDAKGTSGVRKVGESVLKVIKLEGPSCETLRGMNEVEKGGREENAVVGEETASSVAAVTGEVQLLRRMATVPGFTNFRDVWVVYGRPGRAIVDAWRTFNRMRPRGEKSCFPDPGGDYDKNGKKKKTKRTGNARGRAKKNAEKGGEESMVEDDGIDPADEQLWAVIEMQDAGMDLDGFDVIGGRGSVVLNREVGKSGDVQSEEDSWGVFGVWDVFWGVASALAKGENEARFEHRDLHLGNICVRSIPSRIESNSHNIPNKKLDEKVHKRKKIGFTNLEATIIDYTLSRADLEGVSTNKNDHACKPMSNRADTFDETEAREVAYLDLEADPAIFQGDGAIDKQYDMYRYMRAAVLTSNPLATVPPPSTSHATTPKKTSKSKSSTRNNTITHPDPWRAFHPQTNLVWLHFVLSRLMASLEEFEKQQKLQQKQKQKHNNQTNDNKTRAQKRNNKAETTPIEEVEAAEKTNKIKNTADDPSSNDITLNHDTASISNQNNSLHKNAYHQHRQQQARHLTRILKKVQRALKLEALAQQAQPQPQQPEHTNGNADGKSSNSKTKGSSRGTHIAPTTVSSQRKTRRETAQESTASVEGVKSSSACASVRSTVELVGWAVAEGWLDLEDVLVC